MTDEAGAAAAVDFRARGFIAPALIACLAGALAAVAEMLDQPLAAAPLAVAAVVALAALFQRARTAQRTLARAQARMAESEQRVAETAALQTHLLDAVNSISEGFVLFGGDGRLVLCNDRYRRAYPMLSDVLEPGITFDALLRIAAARGAHDPAEGPLEPWVQRRLERHLESRAPADCQLSDGHWYRISEHATGAGGVVKVLMEITALKRHEQELAESGALLQTTLESITQGLAVFDAERRVVAWNSPLPHLLDVAEEALPGTGLSALLRGADLVPAEEAGGAETCEIAVAGRRLEVLVTPMPAPHEGLVATLTDVTDHRRHEAVLTELATGVSGAGGEDFFAALADSLARALHADGALIGELSGDRVEPVAAVRDGRPLALPPLEVAGPLHDILTHGRCLIPAGLESGAGECALAATFGAVACVGRAVTGDHGRPIGLVAVLSRRPLEARASTENLLDIFAARAAAELERQQALAALRDSEARYRHLVERAPYGILLTRGGQVRFANAAARALLAPGDASASPVGRLLPDLLGFEPPAAGEGGLDTMQERLLRPSAGVPERHVQVGLYPLSQEAGDADLVVLADITDRRQAELALQQAQKMDAVGQLAGGIAHEFNNMLTAIGGFARMAERAPGDGGRVATCLAEIIKASDRAAALTAQLLDFSRRRGSDQAVVLDVVDTVRQLKSFLRPVLGETVALTIEPRIDQVRVEVDAARFTQAVVNLAINGRDAIAEKGQGRGLLTIAVDVATVAPDAPLRDRVPTLRGERFAVVEVTDTGTGITPETLDRIFEPFFTTKAQGKGTGLGLPMVYGLATQAGGGLEVDGRPGAGAVFRLYLPAVEDAAAPAPDPLDMPVVDLWGTALLAEDEGPVRDYLRLVLEEHGMEVVACADGEEALAVWREEAEGIDVAVCDVVMPGMGGLDLVRAMREDKPELSVVLVSGYAAEAAPQVAELGEGVTFLAKPVEPARLLAAVRQALER